MFSSVRKRNVGIKSKQQFGGQHKHEFFVIIISGAGNNLVTNMKWFFVVILVSAIKMEAPSKDRNINKSVYNINIATLNNCHGYNEEKC